MNNVLSPSNGESIFDQSPIDVTELPDFPAIRARLEELFKHDIPTETGIVELDETQNSHTTVGEVITNELNSERLTHNSDFMQRISQRFMQKMNEQDALNTDIKTDIKFVPLQPEILPVDQ